MSGISYEPKNDYEAVEMYVTGIAGMASAAMSLLFLPSDVASAHRWARLGTLQRVLELGFPVTKDVVLGAVIDVNKLSKDAAWIKAHPAPAKIKLALKTLAAELEKLRRARPHMLHRETLFPPRVLSALYPKPVQPAKRNEKKNKETR